MSTRKKARRWCDLCCDPLLMPDGTPPRSEHVLICINCWFPMSKTKAKKHYVFCDSTASVFRGDIGTIDECPMT